MKKVSLIDFMGLNIKGEDDNHPDKLHENLVHSIYALVNHPDEWPHTLQMLGAFLDQSDQIPHSETASSIIAHIHRAELLLSEIDKLKLSHKQSHQIIDNVPMAIVLIRHDGYIISSNRRAKKLLQQMHLSSKHQHLHFLKEKHQSAFMQAVRNVFTEHLQGKALRFGDIKLWISYYSNNQLAVFFSDHSSEQHIHTETLQQMYGMTAQEANVTAELCSGKCYLDQVADKLNIRIQTVRSHLKKIYAKTGAHNQSELMKMIILNPALTQLRNNANKPSGEKNPCRLTTLNSGRTISWAEYGDPSGAPVLFCHAITGCRLLPIEIANGLYQKNIRLIAPDRAGYGFSTPAAQDVMAQWQEDMAHFTSQLNIDRYDVIGHSAGGAHAMALAVAYPAHVRRLHLVSSIAPINESDDLKKLLPINRMLCHLININPEAARAFINFGMRNFIKKPHSYFRIITNKLPVEDLLVLKKNHLKERLIEGFMETSRQGINHMIEEMIYIFNHWQIQATDIHCPTIIWHGLEDKHAPPFLMQRFEQCLPDCSQSNWLPGQGHYLLFAHWNEILTQLPCPDAIE